MNDRDTQIIDLLDDVCHWLAIIAWLLTIMLALMFSASIVWLALAA